MKVRQTDLPGVLILQPEVYRDDRGFFVETFSTRCKDESGLPADFGQDNHSRSKRGVLRGLHYQVHSPQGKLVHVARGKILDVAVDVRAGSPDFGRWVAAELDDDNLQSLWIPPGFAHGFCVLSDVADVIYKCTTLYDPQDDRGIAWNDPQIGIEWPLTNPIVSEKDSRHPHLLENRTELPRYMT
jgi:dTDP-4-dehydrorhamnose 3,5-epimerase